MAAQADRLGSLSRPTPVHTPSAQSLHSTNGAAAGGPPDKDFSNLNLNADGGPAPAPAARPTAQKKPTFTSRISGMFARKEAGSAAKDPSLEQISDQATTGDSDSSTGNKQPAKQSKDKDKDKEERLTSKKDRKDAEARAERSDGIERKDKHEVQEKVPRRYWVDENGEHHHHLKAQKRQEKLSDMLRDLVGGGKKKDAHQDDQQLSLMSNFIDSLNREKVASDKQCGPNATHSLVQKYGKCQEVVGRGAFGIVRISHKTDPSNPTLEQLYAVKEFRQRPQESEKKYQKRLTAEFCISSSLRHPNVIHTLDLLQDAKGDYCEVMEYCAGGDLYSLILATGKLETAEADCYFKQLMRGVEYMHDMGVAHRDLKPENTLLTTHGALKITDFGNGECFRMAWETEAHMTNGLCGSAPYIAPEEYVDKEFDPRPLDVWACGVIYMAMRTGRHLWRVAKKDEDEFYARYLEGRKQEDGYGPIETLHRARCRNVIYSILDPNPSRRITASQVLQSEWGREIKLCKAGEEGF